MDISELLLGIEKTDEEDKISYSAGVIMALSLKDIGFEEVNYADFTEGVKSVFQNSYPKISQKKAIDIFNNYVTLLREEIKVKNKEEGQKFLEENARRKEVVSLPSGLQYEILIDGTGKIPAIHDTVTIIYEGALLNNRIFDSTKDDGPRQFKLMDMIPGWQEALLRMPSGSRWKIFIPPHLAYGEAGAPPVVQPNSTLQFTVELIKTEE
ncbi:MAG: FKBP-type peptidyl-prolyl cis-trans isomerase [Flavobacteriaceae bacterium]|jgi:FKBP-type peptidyl-prolyl cis-trans isomerase FklB|nr:FKBP-type peptidyl-prolyl cis-trans isomerase [Flavobacteriaceae bacterium]